MTAPKPNANANVAHPTVTLRQDAGFHSFLSDRQDSPTNIDWMLRAACATSPTPDDFFPTPRTASARQRSPLPAIALCAVCPVRYECLEYALRFHQRFGIWGGLTPNARTRLLNLRTSTSQSSKLAAHILHPDEPDPSLPLPRPPD